MKLFDPKIHFSCPWCNGEVLYIDPEKKTIALVLQDETIDQESEERDPDPKPGDRHQLICNDTRCGWAKDGRIEQTNQEGTETL